MQYIIVNLDLTHINICQCKQQFHWWLFFFKSSTHLIIALLCTLLFRCSSTLCEINGNRIYTMYTIYQLMNFINRPFFFYLFVCLQNSIFCSETIVILFCVCVLFSCRLRERDARRRCNDSLGQKPARSINESQNDTIYANERTRWKIRRILFV